jgi:Predicted permease.
LRISGENALEMLTIIPPIFILLGLLDVWVEREVMIKYIGDRSGVRGGIIAFVLGSAAAGPLYASFPIAAMFLKKGASWRNVLLFIGAWSTTKIPLILFETASLGFNFMDASIRVQRFGNYSNRIDSWAEHSCCTKRGWFGMMLKIFSL